MICSKCGCDVEKEKVGFLYGDRKILWCSLCVEQEPKEDRASKYWICGECADKKGWKGPAWGVTCIRGLCGHCDRPDVTLLTPTIDFDRGPGKPAVWD
jgi:hypothetical protein